MADRLHWGPFVETAAAALALALFHVGVLAFETMVGWELFIIALGVWQVVVNTERRRA